MYNTGRGLLQLIERHYFVVALIISFYNDRVHKCLPTGPLYSPIGFEPQFAEIEFACRRLH
jgi:hypothetical protein